MQGYVCPGILVTLSEGADVRVVQEAWCAHALATPTGYRIYRLGLSGGCSVTPFPQVPTAAILARELANNGHFPPNISRIFCGDECGVSPICGIVHKSRFLHLFIY